MNKTLNKTEQNAITALLAISIILVVITISSALASATTLAIDTLFLKANEEATARIMITNVSNLGVIDIDLGFDPAKFQVTEVANSEFDFLHSVIDQSTGRVRIGGMDYGEGLDGDLVLAEITIKAVGEHGEASPLELCIHEIKEADAIETSISAMTENSTAFINIPPISIALSAHRINNAQSRYKSPAFFTAAPSYDPDGDAIITYAWSFGDESTAIGVNAEHAYAHHKWVDNSYEPFQTILAVNDSFDLLNMTVMPVEVYIAGDANGDGEVNILDAVWIGKHWRAACTGGSEDGYVWEDPQADGADLNNDCEIDILDAVIVGANWRHTAW